MQPHQMPSSASVLLLSRLRRRRFCLPLSLPFARSKERLGYAPGACARSKPYGALTGPVRLRFWPSPLEKLEKPGSRRVTMLLSPSALRRSPYTADSTQQQSRSHGREPLIHSLTEIWRHALGLATQSRDRQRRRRRRRLRPRRRPKRRAAPSSRHLCRREPRSRPRRPPPPPKHPKRPRRRPRSRLSTTRRPLAAAPGCALPRVPEGAEVRDPLRRPWSLQDGDVSSSLTGDTSSVVVIHSPMSLDHTLLPATLASASLTPSSLLHVEQGIDVIDVMYG
jgi:hypothetical protein